MSDDDPWAVDFDGSAPAPLSRPAGRAGAVRARPGPAVDPSPGPLPPPARRPRFSLVGAFVAGLGFAPLGVAFAAAVGLGLRRMLAPPTAVVLPAAGLFVVLLLLASQRRGFGVGIWGSALSALLVLPIYFPGELELGLTTGAHFLSQGLAEDSREQTASAARWTGAVLDRWGSLAGAHPPGRALEPEPAEPSPGPRAPADVTSAPDEPTRDAQTPAPPVNETVVLPFDADGHSVKVAAVFEGPAEAVEMKVLFDTGATFTTLDRDALARIGVQVPGDAPVARFQTAAGAMESPLVLLPSVELGGRRIEHVTVAVCEDCSQGDAVGLLGLNVSGQFEVSVDNEYGEVRLRPREQPDRRLDVENWVDVRASGRRFVGGPLQVELTAENRASQAVRDAVVELACPDSAYTVEFDHVPAGGERSTRIELPGDKCPELRTILRSARW